MRALALVMLACGCRALPPPPVLAPLAGTAPDAEGATTAMLVIGTAGQLLGGDGLGVAIRVEHQTTERTALGLEIAGGRSHQGTFEDGTMFRHALIAVRGYGRSTPHGSRDVALLYGAGLSWTTTGLVTGSLSLGGEASYENTHLVPLAALGAALAVPLRRGRAFKLDQLDVMFGEPLHGLHPARTKPQYVRAKTELYVTLDLGLVAPLGSTGNAFALDVGLGMATRAHEAIYEASAADSQRFDP